MARSKRNVDRIKGLPLSTLATLIWLVLLLCSKKNDHQASSFLVEAVEMVMEDNKDGRCPMECITKRNGVCKGFAGADCSFPYEICPDLVTQCFGTLAVCSSPRTTMVTTTTTATTTSAIEDEDNIDNDVTTKAVHELYNDGSQKSVQYSCACTVHVTASSSSSTTAIIRTAQIQDCVDRETEVCEENQAVSTYAFCSNGGKCMAKIPKGNPHPGCTCPGYFEGQFCEYRRGGTPGDPVSDTGLSKESDTLQQDDIPSAQLWIIVVIFMILTGVVVVVLVCGSFNIMCMGTRSGTGGPREVHSVGLPVENSPWDLSAAQFSNIEAASSTTLQSDAVDMFDTTSWVAGTDAEFSNISLSKLAANEDFESHFVSRIDNIAML